MNGESQMEQYIVMAEMHRRCRRENDRLREQLGLRTEAAREFARQDAEVFALVRQNRQRRCAV